MKAIQITTFGGPEVLLPTELPRPRPSPGQVLVRVAVAGVNFAETLMREDKYVASYDLPAVPGSEIAGTVVKLGEGVEQFVIGQRVAAILSAARVLTGGYAQYAVADQTVVAPIPDSLEFRQAVPLLVQGLTALHLVREVDPAKQDILVTAAGGGVGSMLLQLGRRAGARRIVAAASSGAKRQLALSMGADEAVGYDELEGLEPTLIYDSVGGEVFARCQSILGFKGTVVLYGSLNLQRFSLGVSDLKRMVFRNQTIRGFSFGPLIQKGGLQADLAQLFQLVSDGALQTPIGAIFPLANAAEAHRRLGERDTTGKILLCCE